MASSGDDWDASDDETTKPAPVAAPVIAAKKGRFADEDVEEEVKDSWEDSDEEEKPSAPTGPAPPVRQKGITRAKIAEKEAAEAAKMQAALERESESPSERKRRELAEQMQQDLENATALFGDSSVSENAKNGLAGNSNPLEAGGANPRTKAQFYALSEALAKHITDAHGSKPLYADFVEHFARQLCLPLKDLDVKKVSSTLAALGNEKQRLQKEAQGVGKKKGGAKGKPQLGTVSGTGGGAKTAVMAGGRGYAADLDSHDVAMDDYDDDFM